MNKYELENLKKIKEEEAKPNPNKNRISYLKIKSQCGTCGISMVGRDLGTIIECPISYKDGCPDKGDGGW